MSSGSDFTKAQTFFNYGNDAAMKQNFEYAIQMYREACKIDVDVGEGRKAPQISRPRSAPGRC